VFLIQLGKVGFAFLVVYVATKINLSFYCFVFSAQTVM